MKPYLVFENASNYPQLKWFGPLVGHHGAIIAGGCFKDIFDRNPVRDIDLWFPNQDALNLMSDELRNLPNEYAPAYVTDNCIAYRHIKSHTIIELISRRFGNPHEIIEGFDFSVVKFAYFIDESLNTPCVLRHINFFDDLKKKELNLDVELRDELGDMEPEFHMPSGDRLFNRIIKYTQYGFYIPLRTKHYLVDCIKSPHTRLISEVNNHGY